MFFRNYFVVDFSDYPDQDEATAVPNSEDAALIPFLSQRLIGLPIMWRPLPSLTIPCRVKWKRFTKKLGEREKRIGLV